MTFTTRNLLSMALALSAVLTIPLASVDAQEKYAVFVGINDYLAYEDEPGGDLQGAERDALSMRTVLTERWGLREENTRTLLSRAATKDAIRDVITGWLTAQAGPGDLAIFYFAGHGAQAFDLDGDEPDGLDETLAPTDILPLSSANDIRDDEFRLWLMGIGTDVVVILDSCHSGTATRGGNMRTRSLDRPLPSEGGQEPERVRQRYDPESMSDGGGRIIELSAAAPNQSAVEGDFPSGERGGTEARGAFTYHLVRELRASSDGTSYQDLLSHLVSSMKADQFMQDPQLTGDGVLFGTARSKAAPAIFLQDNAPLDKAATPANVVFPAAHLSVDASSVPPARRVELRTALAADSDIELLDSAARAADLYLLADNTDSFIEILGKDGQRRSIASVGSAEGTIVATTVRALRHAWAERALAALVNPTRPFGIDITSTRVEGVQGDADATITVTSDRPGYLAVVTLGTDGRFEVLIHGATDRRLDAEEPVRIELEGPTSVTGSEKGLRFVLAIVTPEPLATMAAPTPSSETRDQLMALRLALEGATGTPGSALKWNSRLIVMQPAAR